MGETRTSGENPGIRIVPGPVDPAEAQFVPGASNVVPPTAAPATDIGVSRARSLAAAPFYACSGFSGIERPNPVENLYADTFTWAPYAAYKVGDGNGNINWSLNPYKNASWYMWLHSLRWLGQGIIAGGKGDLKALARVNAIAYDWYRDNPYSWKANVGAWESTMHRTNVLICLRQAVLAGLQVTELPADYAWVDMALLSHARFLTNYWSGAWNHGTDESIALFGVGCTLNRDDYKNLAQQRLGAAITTSIDAEGATNEQSTGYASFNYSLWGRASTVLQNCGVDPGTTIATRRDLLAKFLTLATNSLGKLHQIGDTEVQATSPYAGTPMEYAGSLGTAGAAPPWRVANYSAGYVFGRTGWGTDPGRTFADESTYSIRYGPARAFHGHFDHTSITYTSRGREILVDGGFAAYNAGAYRTWVVSPSAHSVLTTPLSANANPVTRLTSSSVKDTAESYVLTDAPATGVSRIRSVLVLKDPDLLVVWDRASSKTAQQFQTLWHLPADQKASIYSRTTAIAMAPGDTSRTILFQVPFKQALPPGAILLKQAQTNPIQGWQYPSSFVRNSAPTLMLARSGTTASILSFVVPVKATGGVTYAIRQSGTTTIFDLSVAGRKTSVAISGGGSLFRAG
ncbi:heparinase II/III domain-containing protein [Kribbella sp.]|uniref:heparinase II/III domain-containing protein n=1 Tax=Kribbella sp. TaxID=1871183 RepID=UPI002D582965|nr:heparinase II/III family protein [Kribbella sp.]HZX05029.1 heparinase II/III family protein [Kribbella sp.]